MRTLSDSLSPSERAVYVLREAFDYPYRQIADLLGLSEANARQLLARARARLLDARRSHAGGDHRRLLAAFTTAAQSGDLAPLEQLLADEASGALVIAA